MKIFTFFVMSLLSGGMSWAAITVVADYTAIPDDQAGSFTLAGTTVSGSSFVKSGSVFDNRGLGIRGGTFLPTSDYTLDLGETMTIDYGNLVDNVTLTVVDIDPPGNVVYGFQAFAGSTNLGIFSIPPHSQGIETKNITMLAGGALLSKITLVVTQSAPAGLQIQQTSFTVVPEPANLALVGLSATILRRRTR